MIMINNILLTVLLQASGFKSTVNDILDKWFVPLVILCIFLGAGTGLAKNWKNISDETGSGSRKEGIISVVYYIGYSILAIATLGGIKFIVSGFTLSM